jgi:hypothetical protein
MLLSGALFALFMMGFWLYCLTDAILTPPAECRGLQKPTWIAVIAVTFIGGAVAWLIVRRPARDSSVPLMPLALEDSDGRRDGGHVQGHRWTDPEGALSRHPAGRARAADALPRAPKGPDDDAEFLRALDRAIRRNPPVSLRRSTVSLRRSTVSLRRSRSAARR